MCGIVGCYSDSTKSIQLALNAIQHRGPDASADITYPVGRNFLQIAANRLAIIDTVPRSNQPLVSSDGRYTLAFNGEIYNYRQIKQELELDGIVFNTMSDTEVLLQYLIVNGQTKLDQLDGMFAFCFYDNIEERILLCRDPLGIKPLYYHQNNQQLYFGSEIRAIFALNENLKGIDQSLISEFLLTNFIYEPETGFQHIRKVKPGHYLTVQISTDGLEYSEVKYFTQNFEHKQYYNASDYDQQILREINNHLQADVEIGLFFSGGVDSTLILSKTKDDLQNLTLGASERDYAAAGQENDGTYARTTAKLINVSLDELHINDRLKHPVDFLEAINFVAEGIEELCGDFTYYSSWLLSHGAKQHNKTVMLSGLGADELFGGYDRYRIVAHEWFYKLLLPFAPLLRKNKKFNKKLSRLISYFKQKDFGLKYSALVGYFSVDDVISLTGSNVGVEKFKRKLHGYLSPLHGISSYKKAVSLDLAGFITHNFIVADKSSMQASIELRVPLATKGLLGMIATDRDKNHIGLFKTKKILKSILSGIIPQNIINRRKTGFNAPMDRYVDMLSSEVILTEMSRSTIFTYVNKSAVTSIISDHYSKKSNNTYKIFSLLYLSAWLRKYD